MTLSGCGLVGYWAGRVAVERGDHAIRHSSTVLSPTSSGSTRSSRSETNLRPCLAAKRFWISLLYHFHLFVVNII